MKNCRQWNLSQHLVADSLDWRLLKSQDCTAVAEMHVHIDKNKSTVRSSYAWMKDTDWWHEYFVVLINQGRHCGFIASKEQISSLHCVGAQKASRDPSCSASYLILSPFQTKTKEVSQASPQEDWVSSCWRAVLTSVLCVLLLCLQPHQGIKDFLRQEVEGKKWERHFYALG